MAFYDDIPNVADCSDVAQLYECALLTINNSKLLRDWVNGSETTNVTLGGQSMPSLRKLIQNINRVAGIATSISPGAVRPDNVTTQVDALGVLSVIAAGIIKSGGGLVAGTDGKLLVDFSTMPASQLSAMLSSLIQTGGGLSVNSEGKFYFDAQSMDTEVFENMLKKLRLQKWLTANTNFYVDKSHAAASDTLDEGRGLSASKPFKTIQACVNYVCDNYNVGPYKAIIHIASGIYDPVTLGNFSYTTGLIQLEFDDGASIKRNSTGYVLTITAGNYNIFPVQLAFEMDFGNLSGTPFFGNGCIYASGGNLTVNGLNAAIKILGNNASGRRCNMELVSLSGGGNVTILPSSKAQKLVMDVANASTNNLNYYALRSAGASILTLGDTAVAGADGAISTEGLFTAFANTSNKGSIIRSSASAVKTSFTIPSGKTVTGQRYKCDSGGTINTYNAGNEYFPGSTAGTVESSTYSWYK